MSVRDMCDRTAEFFHVMSVFVVLSACVESAMKCQMTCFMKFFFRLRTLATVRRGMAAMVSAVSDVARTRSVPPEQEVFILYFCENASKDSHTSF